MHDYGYLDEPAADFWDEPVEERGASDEARGWVQTPSGLALIALVGLLVIATIAGLIALWPQGQTTVASTQAFGGASVGAVITAETTAACANTPVEQTCRTVEIELKDGPDAGQTASVILGPSDYTPSYAVGSDVRVVKSSQAAPETGASAQPTSHASSYSVIDYDRRGGMLWLGLVLGLCVAVVGRWRGALSLIGLGVSIALVTQFMVPAIIAGESPFLVALVGSMAAMFITVAFSSGLGVQSLAAALGIAGSLLVASLLALLYVHIAHLNGFTSELAFTLRQAGQSVSLQGLVLAGMVIASLGVLADMAVSQASAVMALRKANPGLRVGQLYRGAFSVGRDHFAATVNTLVFAYVGASLPLLILFKSAGVHFTDAINAQDVAEPIIGILIGAVAVISSVPLTTGLAAMLAAGVPPQALDVHAHHH